MLPSGKHALRSTQNRLQACQWLCRQQAVTAALSVDRNAHRSQQDVQKQCQVKVCWGTLVSIFNLYILQTHYNTTIRRSHSVCKHTQPAPVVSHHCAVSISASEEAATQHSRCPLHKMSLLPVPSALCNHTIIQQAVVCTAEPTTAAAHLPHPFWPQDP